MFKLLQTLKSTPVLAFTYIMYYISQTRILCTNGISFLPNVDQIIVLEQGKISEMGSYKQLLNAGTAFAEFLKNYLMEEEEELCEEIDEDG